MRFAKAQLAARSVHRRYLHTFRKTMIVLRVVHIYLFLNHSEACDGELPNTARDCILAAVHFLVAPCHLSLPVALHFCLHLKTVRTSFALWK